MGLKTDSSPINARLSKMEAAIENIGTDGAQGGYGYHNQGCVRKGAQVDHVDGQERAPSGQLGYGDPSRRTQIGRVQSSTCASRALRPRKVR
jgi:hypothetical protein